MPSRTPSGPRSSSPSRGTPPVRRPARVLGLSRRARARHAAPGIGAVEPRARGPAGGRGRTLERARMPVRSGARARTVRRRGSPPPRSRDAARARRAAVAVIVARRLRERGVRGLPRGPRPSTRRNRRASHRPRARRPATPRRRAQQRGDRRAAVPLAAHGRPSRLGDPAEARRPHPRRGRDEGGGARSPRGLRGFAGPRGGATMRRHQNR